MTVMVDKTTGSTPHQRPPVLPFQQEISKVKPSEKDTVPELAGGSP